MSIMEKLKGLFGKKKPKEECKDECCCKKEEPTAEAAPAPEAPVEAAPKKASNTAPWQELDRKISGKK